MSSGGISVLGSSTFTWRAKIRATISRRLQWTSSVLRLVPVAHATALSVLIVLVFKASR
jgi:hypothetical protein